MTILALLAIFAVVAYVRLAQTNIDVPDGAEKYSDTIEGEAQTVIYIQPREGVPLPRS